MLRAFRSQRHHRFRRQRVCRPQSRSCPASLLAWQTLSAAALSTPVLSRRSRPFQPCWSTFSAPLPPPTTARSFCDARTETAPRPSLVLLLHLFARLLPSTLALSFLAAYAIVLGHRQTVATPAVFGWALTTTRNCTAYGSTTELSGYHDVLAAPATAAAAAAAARSQLQDSTCIAIVAPRSPTSTPAASTQVRIAAPLPEIETSPRYKARVRSAFQPANDSVRKARHAEAQFRREQRC